MNYNSPNLTNKEINTSNRIFQINSTLPGSGKTYTTAQLIWRLTCCNVKVYPTGVSWKAVNALNNEMRKLEVELKCKLPTAITTKAFTRDYNHYAENGQHYYHSKKLKLHKNTKGVIVIDEASLLPKGYIEDIAKAYPNCNILLTGDPNQFMPIEDYTSMDLEVIHNYKAIAYKAAPENTYTLNGCYRLKDNPKLIELLKKIKAGTVELHDLYLEGMPKDGSLYISFLNKDWKATEGVEDIYRVEELDRETGLAKGEIYRKVGDNFISLENGKAVNKLPKAVRSPFVNAHKVQGATIHYQVCVVIDDESLDTMIKHGQLQRFLYVALSRSSDTQFAFSCDEDKLREALKTFKPMDEVVGEIHNLNELVMKLEEIPEAVVRGPNKSRIEATIDKYYGLMLSWFTKEEISEMTDEEIESNLNKLRRGSLSEVVVTSITQQLRSYLATQQGAQRQLHARSSEVATVAASFEHEANNSKSDELPLKKEVVADTQISSPDYSNMSDAELKSFLDSLFTDDIFQKRND